MKKIGCLVLAITLLSICSSYGFSVHPTAMPLDTVYPPNVTMIEYETRLFCPNPTDFSPPITVTNLGCTELNYGGIDDLNAGDLCGTYTAGIVAGTDTLCLEICDDTHCDTYIYYINVSPNFPTANDDIATTSQGVPISIPILQNDVFAGEIPDISILTPLENGDITFIQIEGLTGLAYEPAAGFCGTEIIEYEICTPTLLCDTATLTITVECNVVSVNVFNGFSPNGDNINDYFTVEGLENTTRDKIFIYNRWGSQVFKANDYQNDWNGTWNGENLPDGTYFYVIDDGENNEYHGYIELRR